MRFKFFNPVVYVYHPEANQQLLFPHFTHERRLQDWQVNYQPMSEGVHSSFIEINSINSNLCLDIFLKKTFV